MLCAARPPAKLSQGWPWKHKACRSGVTVMTDPHLTMAHTEVPPSSSRTICELQCQLCKLLCSFCY
jgi:hypothetical protein